MAHHGGLLVELAITWAVWSTTCFRLFLAKASGLARASSTVSGSSGHEGVYTRVAVVLEQADPLVPAARQQPEPIDEDDRRLAARVGFIDLALLALRDSAMVAPLPLGVAPQGRASGAPRSARERA
jgi:hypothetical protein